MQPSSPELSLVNHIFGSCRGKNIVKSELFNIHSTSFFNIPPVQWNFSLGIQLYTSTDGQPALAGF